MANLSAALESAQSLLNDAAKTLWTDAILIPFAKEAHRELQVALAKAGVPGIRKWSAKIDVVANTISFKDGGILPADLIEPIDLQERAVGGSAWGDMTQADPLTGISSDSRLEYWNWVDSDIQLDKCTINREVRIYYRSLITVPVAAGDPIGYTFGELYIGPRTAALAAGSVGNKTLRDALTEEALTKIGGVIEANRDKTTPLVRP